MRKRASTITLALLIALLSLQIALTVEPALAYDPGQPNDLSAYVLVRAAATQDADLSPPPIPNPKVGSSAVHNTKAKALKAEKAVSGGGNTAHGKAKTWMTGGVVYSETSLIVTGNDADATAWTDPAGGPGRMDVGDVVLERRPSAEVWTGVARVEISVTDQNGGRVLILYWAELGPAGLTTSGNWPKTWDQTNYQGRRLAHHGPFYYSTSSTDGKSYWQHHASISGGSGGTAVVKTSVPVVGGVYIAPNQLELLAPLIILGATIPITIAFVTIYKRKHRP